MLCDLQAPRATAEPSQRVPPAADHSAASSAAAADAALDGARRFDACGGPSGKCRRRGKRHRGRQLAKSLGSGSFCGPRQVSR